MELFGYLSAICFAVSYLPQIFKTAKRKKVKDISLWLWVLNALAYTFGLIYGLGLTELPLILNYGFGLICGSIILWQYWRYR